MYGLIASMELYSTIVGIIFVFFFFVFFLVGSIISHIIDWIKNKDK